MTPMQSLSERLHPELTLAVLDAPLAGSFRPVAGEALWVAIRTLRPQEIAPAVGAMQSRLERLVAGLLPPGAGRAKP